MEVERSDISALSATIEALSGLGREVPVNFVQRRLRWWAQGSPGWDCEVCGIRSPHGENCDPHRRARCLMCAINDRCPACLAAADQDLAGAAEEGLVID